MPTKVVKPKEPIEAKVKLRDLQDALTDIKGALDKLGHAFEEKAEPRTRTVKLAVGPFFKPGSDGGYIPGLCDPGPRGDLCEALERIYNLLRLFCDTVRRPKGTLVRPKTP